MFFYMLLDSVSGLLILQFFFLPSCEGVKQLGTETF